MQEKILELLNNQKEPLTFDQIKEQLNLNTADEYKELGEELSKLGKDLEVFITKKEKYILYKNMPGIRKGILNIKEKGYGFLIIEGENDWFIPIDNLNGARHKDIVMCEIDTKTKKEGDNPVGRVIKILEEAKLPNVGEVIVKDNEKFIKLTGENLTLKLSDNNSFHAVEGEIVEVRIDSSKKDRIATIIRNICHKNDPRSDIMEKAALYNFFVDFPQEVVDQVKDIPDYVLDSEIESRKDLRDLIIFTIDGDDTKDIDDALSLEILPDGIIRLGVHIANVYHYVKEGTSIYNEAMERGTSAYLADTSIPMLPRELSNGICSLNPNVDRLAVSCVMDIDQNGKVINYDIFESVIRSRIQMTYKKVNDILEHNIIAKEYEPYKDILFQMNDLAKKLRKVKIARGYIDFNVEEAKIVQNEQGLAIDVIKRVIGPGEMLIEDFMIVANETVLTHLTNLGIPAIYRDHDAPDPERIERFVNMLSILGYKYDGKLTELSPIGMQKIINFIADKKEFPVLSKLLLRSMKKADYQAVNIGHFGLGSTCYGHFTSPIRRLADLQIHRILETVCFKEQFTNDTYSKLNNELDSIAYQASQREVAAVNAERDVFAMKSAEYMSSKIKEIYKGIIDGVTSYGLFVELDNLVEGLVPIASLKGDFYEYVEEKLALIGKSTKKTYRLGDEVVVKVISASKELSQIDFEIVEQKSE